VRGRVIDGRRPGRERVRRGKRRQQLTTDEAGLRTVAEAAVTPRDRQL
jgi:hypothetical protein